MVNFEQLSLKNNYSVKAISKELYDSFRAQHEPIIFDNRFDMDTDAALSAEEKNSLKALASSFGEVQELRLGFFLKDEMVGWHYGIQASTDSLRMATSGVLIEHQRKGIYSSFLPQYLDYLKKIGYQIVFSRHYATDNQVIIPKLRAGFLISGVELTDKYGLLVHLSYYFNELRRSAMHMRSGLYQASDQLKALIRQYD